MFSDVGRKIDARRQLGSIIGRTEMAKTPESGEDLVQGLQERLSEEWNGEEEDRETEWKRPSE